MPTKQRDNVHFEIEGYFPKGPMSKLLQTDPSTWEREWRLWHTVNTLFDARATLRTGKYLCHRTCPLSYTQLRLIRIDKKGRRVVK